MHTIKIPKISPEAYIFQRPFLRGDLTEGFLCYWIGGPIFGGLIPGGAYFWNFTVCVLPITPFLHKGTTGLGGAYIWRAYTWRGLFLEFYSMCSSYCSIPA